MNIVNSRLGKAIAADPARFDAIIASHMVTIQSLPRSYREAIYLGVEGVVKQMLPPSMSGFSREILTAVSSDFNFQGRGLKRRADAQEISGGRNVATKRRVLQAPRRLVQPVGNFSQDTTMSKSCEGKLSAKQISAATATAFGVVTSMSLLHFYTEIFKKYKTEKVFFLSLAVVSAVYFASPGIIGTIVPWLIGQASRTVVASMLNKYPVFTPDKEVGIGKRAFGVVIRAALVVGLMASTAAMTASTTVAKQMSRAWEDKYGEQERVYAESAANVTASVATSWIPWWPSTGQATKGATAEVSNVSGNLTDMASEFTFQTGVAITEAPESVRKLLGYIACALEIIPWNARGKKYAKYLRAIEAAMGGYTGNIKKGDILISTGTSDGYARIKKEYHNANVRLLSQGSLTLILGGDMQDLFSSFSNAAKWAWDSMRGKIVEPVRKAVEDERESWTTSAYKFSKTVTFKNGVYIVLPLAIQAIPRAAAFAISGASSAFAQDKKKTTKRKPSMFNKRVAVELKKYKTKAKSAEEQQKRMARCSRRVAKEMRKEKTYKFHQKK